MREGKLDVAHQLAAEAQLSDAGYLEQPYSAMHRILQHIKNKDLLPALEWAEQNRSRVSPDGKPTAFEFQIHSLQFVSQLQSAGQQAALRYARTHFAPFRSFQRQIQRLMGCLLFADRPAASSPYADLFDPARWEQVSQEFTRLACGLMGQVRRAHRYYMIRTCMFSIICVHELCLRQVIVAGQ